MLKISSIVALPTKCVGDFIRNVHGQEWFLVIITFIFLYGSYLRDYGLGLLDTPHVDLPTFYAASIQFFMQAGSPYKLEELQLLMGSDIYVFPYLYPPPSLLAFWPISFLEYTTAQHLILAANHLLILCLISLVFLLLPKKRGQSNPLLYLVTIVYFFTFHPIVVTLGHGQVNLLMLAFILSFWLLAKRDKPIVAALALALAVLLKTYPVILLPLLFLSGRKRECLYTMSWLLLFVGVSFCVVPLTVWSEWLTQILPSGGYGKTPEGLFSIASISNQSLNGFLARQFIEQPQILRTYTYAVAGLLALVTGVTVWLSHKHNRGSLDKVMIIALPTIYLLAPLSWVHHLVYLLPSIILLLVSKINLPVFWATCFRCIIAVVAIILARGIMIHFYFIAVLCLWLLSLLFVYLKTDDSLLADEEAELRNTLME